MLLDIGLKSTARLTRKPCVEQVRETRLGKLESRARFSALSHLMPDMASRSHPTPLYMTSILPHIKPGIPGHPSIWHMSTSQDTHSQPTVPHRTHRGIRRCGTKRKELLIHPAPSHPYHCPKYDEGQSTRFQELPAEILLRIIACLDSLLDIRALRCLRIATKETNIGYLGDVIDDILNQQRSDFLAGKHLIEGRNNYVGTPKRKYKTDESLQQFVGKQFVREAENIDGDPWVGTFCSSGSPVMLLNP